jgi:hypothetical protein
MRTAVGPVADEWNPCHRRRLRTYRDFSVSFKFKNAVSLIDFEIVRPIINTGQFGVA